MHLTTVLLSERHSDASFVVSANLYTKRCGFFQGVDFFLMPAFIFPLSRSMCFQYGAMSALQNFLELYPQSSAYLTPQTSRKNRY